MQQNRSILGAKNKQVGRFQERLRKFHSLTSGRSGQEGDFDRECEVKNHGRASHLLYSRNQEQKSGSFGFLGLYYVMNHER